LNFVKWHWKEMMEVIQERKLDNLNRDFFYFKQGIRFRIQTVFGVIIVIIQLSKDMYNQYYYGRHGLSRMCKLLALSEARSMVRKEIKKRRNHEKTNL